MIELISGVEEQAAIQQEMSTWLRKRGDDNIFQGAHGHDSRRVAFPGPCVGLLSCCIHHSHLKNFSITSFPQQRADLLLDRSPLFCSTTSKTLSTPFPT